MIWFTSDTHFGHENILKYCNRPFKTVNEMNSRLIENWNSVVQPDDQVWHLGDFCFPWGGENTKYFLDNLNGWINIVWGNHDKDARQYRNLFYSYQDYRELKLQVPGMGDKPITIVLSHYPMRAWNKCHRGSWHLFGHLHTNKMCNIDWGLCLDVGVDANNFRPISLEEIKEKMDLRIKKGAICIPHH